MPVRIAKRGSVGHSFPHGGSFPNRWVSKRYVASIVALCVTSNVLIRVSEKELH